MSNNEYGDRFDQYSKHSEEVYEYDDELIDIRLDDDEIEYLEYDEQEENYDEKKEEKPFDHYEKNLKSGDFEVREVKNHPVLTFFFFPVAMLFLEFVFRIGLGLKFFNGVLYVLVFSIAFGVFLTLLSTISKKAITNRRIARILLGIVSLNYIIQFIYYSIFKRLLDIIEIKNLSLFVINDSYAEVIKVLREKAVYLVLFVVPFILLCVLGKWVFPFARASWGYKLTAIGVLAAVILLSIFVIGSSSKKDENSSITIVQRNNQIEKTQNFGLEAAQIIDVYNLIAPKVDYTVLSFKLPTESTTAEK